MKKIIFAAVSFLMIFAAAAVMCLALQADVYISNQDGNTEIASVGDVISVHTDGIPNDRLVTWYVNGSKYGKISNTLTVTSDLMGCTVNAYITYDETSVTTNVIKINSTAPTVELTGVAGDYSAYLTWSASSNGSPIDGYVITYYSTDSPETELGRLTLPSDSSAVTLTGLSGGIEYVIKITAHNSEGSTSASVVLTPNDPDLAAVTAVKNEIEASSVAIHMNLANTKEAVTNYLLSYFGRYNEYGIVIKDVIITDFTAAEKLSAENPEAEVGRFTFVLEIQKGDVCLTTRRIDAEIDNKTSIVFLTANKFSVMTGEELNVTAMALDIDDNAYSWYIAYSDTDEGTLVQSSEENVYTVNTEKAGEFYIYCISGGVSSSRLKLTVSEPFITVTDIELSTEIITASESEILKSTVYPSNAANKNIIWTIENDGGCLAELSGRTLTAYKPGIITIKATIADGLQDEDFEKVFYITVKERSSAQNDTEVTDDQPDSLIRETELDCSKISGIESVTVTNENGSIQITPVTDETVKRVLNESNIETDKNDIIGAIKFVYENGAIAHETRIKIKGYDGKTVKILSVTGNGGRNLTKQVPENGIIYGNTVSPDIVILLKEKSVMNNDDIFPAAFIIIIPAAAAAVFIAYIVINGDKIKRKKKVK